MMFRWIPRSRQSRFPGMLAIVAAMVVLTVHPATADEPGDDGFRGVGEFPWEGWFGPLSDGLYGLRFGTTGFDVSAVMEEKGLLAVNSRDHTLRFSGKVLGHNAEVLTEFSGARPTLKSASLRAIQIRWILRGLPQESARRFGQLKDMLEKRYGDPITSEEGSLAGLEHGQSLYRRLYYGQQAIALLELQAESQEEYSLLIRLECPQLTASGGE